MPNSKPLTNLQIAELLRDVAAAYQYKDQNKYKFQIIAYERAADAVEHASSELKDFFKDQDTAAFRAFRRGRLKREAQVRQGIFPEIPSA